MTVPLFNLACWIIFLLYWFISAAAVKPIENTTGWFSGNWHRILLLLAFSFIVGFRPLASAGLPIGSWAVSLLPPSLLLNIVIVALLIGGLVVAITARRTLSANWSGQVAIMQDHELITSGLYGYVRNPIYTGILLMTLGTALAYGSLSALLGFVFFLFGIYLKLSAEERILIRHFGQKYTAYKQRTKVLIPFIW